MNRLEKLHWLQQWYTDHRTELQSQPAMVEAIKADHEVRDIIRDLWFALWNKPLGGCSQCHADALIYLLNKKTEQRMEQIVTCRFRLKQGALLTDTTGRLPDATIANLTDEIAIAYLQDNPARADYFEVIPEGWENFAQVSGTDTEVGNYTTEEAKGAENAEKAENIETTAKATPKPAKRTTKR